ncbi:MAG: ABC transporter permease [Planctomycetota bacterium]
MANSGWSKMLSDGWDLAAKDLRSYFRDRAGLALGFLMPIALVTVFGVVMAYAFGGSGGTPKISMMLVDLDQTPASKRLVQGLADSEMLRVRNVTGREEDTKAYVRKEIAEGDAHHGLVIEAGYGQALDEGQVPTLTLLRDPGRTMERQIIQFALMQEMISLGDSDLIFATLGKLFQDNGLDTEQWDSLREQFQQTSGVIQDWIDDGSLSFDADEGEPVNEGTDNDAAESNGTENDSESGPASSSEPPTAKSEPDAGETTTNPMAMMADLLPIETEDISPPDRAAQVTYQQAQSVSGISVMMLLFGLVGAGSVLLREREEGTLSRLMSLPIRRESIVAGKFLYVAVVGVIQMTVLMVYGEFFFRVGLFQSPITMIVIVLTWIAVGSAFAMLLATACRSSKQADGLSSILILVMSALGGCWFPVQLMNFPDWLDTLTKTMPTYWAMSCFQGMLWNKLTITDPKLLFGLGVQWAYVIVMGVLAMYLYGRDQTGSV